MHVGYQDDQYFNGRVRDFQAYEQHLLAALEEGGRELQLQKSSVWIPALDHMEDEQVCPAVQALWQRYARAKGGIIALGSASEGAHTTEPSSMRMAAFPLCR